MGESFEKVTLSIGKHSWLENGPRIEEVFPIDHGGFSIASTPSWDLKMDPWKSRFLLEGSVLVVFFQKSS